MLRSLSLCTLLACAPAPTPHPDGGSAGGGTAGPDGGSGGEAGQGGGSDGGGAAGGSGSRWELGAAIDTSAPPFSSQPHALSPGPRWAGRTGPLPTNVWWEDALLGTGELPLNVLPYLVKPQAGGLQLSMPRLEVQPRSVLSVFNADLSLETVEPLGPFVRAADDLFSLTLSWATAGRALTTPLVRGMPYVTGVYRAATVKLRTVHALLKVNGAAPGTLTADRLLLELNSGQRWVVYFSRALSLSCAGSSIEASAPFDGTVRVAFVPDDAALAALDAHRGAWPTGGEVQVTAEGDTATVRFEWSRSGEGPLLMAALPHHLPLLGPVATTPLRFTTVRGAMPTVEGDRWSLTRALPQVRFAAPRPVAAEHLAEVRAALTADAASSTQAEDPYFFGKQVARLARLALIADELGETAIAASVRARLEQQLEPWLSASSPLRYDPVWGGLCSKKGLADPGADFGNGWYNDHHFHYGYFLYAAAAVGRHDAPWLSAHLPALRALARDIANPAAGDRHFTRFRHHDWYESHSWAAGLFAFADGRNQESTSEAVNAWYALALLGQAAGDANLEWLGRVLLAQELDGARTYWQIRSGSTIYPEPFAAGRVVGVLWGSKVDYATFFGANVEFIHGIQLLPFTPITEALLPSAWVREAYPVVAAASAGAEAGWRGFIAMEHAIIDPASAWAELSALTAFDDGNSKTNALYWAATRPLETP
ncbi:MAG: hypothetical protein IPJ65_23175 [Archangiaceae bacterium]|nr:hypothetical protein [Archangiaceae bacterium]